MSVTLPSRHPLLTPQWTKNELWRRARSVPSLDLRFADNKSLVDATTGQNLVTFTRASSGTYVDSQGVIRTATTNLLLRSEEFSDAVWLKTAVSVNADVEVAPNGTVTADKLVEDTDTSAHQLAFNLSFNYVSGTTYTLSCYIKAAGRSRFQLAWRSDWFPPDSSAVADLSTGTISVGTNATGTIEAVGNGWYRISVTSTADATGSSPSDLFLGLVNDAGSSNYTGDGTSGIFIWGAQLEQSSTVGEYIPTTSTINSAPRFDHNPTTGESLGLLVEESRTNLVRNNTMVGAVAGSPGTPPTNGWVITNNATYASSIIGTGIENGINYIDVQYVIAAGAAASGGIVYADTPAATASTVYTGSYYLKLVSGNGPQIRFVWQDGVSTFNRTFFNLTNVLTRYADTVTTSVGANLARFAISFAASPSGATFVIRIGLPQVEQGAFPTSVIPTTTATVTRSADVASITGSNFSSWYRQDEGTVFAESTNNAANTVRYIYAIQQSGSTSNRIDLNINTSNVMNPRTVISGSAVASLSGGTYTSGVAARLAFAFKVTDYGSSLNGATPITAVTAGALPASLAEMYIGSLVGSGVLNGTIKRLAYFPARLANETLQRITQ